MGTGVQTADTRYNVFQPKLPYDFRRYKLYIFVTDNVVFLVVFKECVYQRVFVYYAEPFLLLA
jgi:hypothetical protein